MARPQCDTPLVEIRAFQKMKCPQELHFFKPLTFCKRKMPLNKVPALQIHCEMSANALWTWKPQAHPCWVFACNYKGSHDGGLGFQTFLPCPWMTSCTSSEEHLLKKELPIIWSRIWLLYRRCLRFNTLDVLMCISLLEPKPTLLT